MSISRLLLGGVVVAVGMGGASAFKRPAPEVVAAQSVQAVPSQSELPPLSPPPVVAPSTIAPSFPPYPSHQITACSGRPQNANFRSRPSLAPSAILGVVAAGDSVYLTGRTTMGDGLLWYEAISPTLYPSPDVEAQNKLDAEQTGWIASCFVGKQ